MDRLDGRVRRRGEKSEDQMRARVVGRHLEPERLVFIDETDMAPLRCGRARKNDADSVFWPAVCVPRYSKFGELG
jgi:hypothetical protein